MPDDRYQVRTTDKQSTGVDESRQLSGGEGATSGAPDETTQKPEPKTRQRGILLGAVAVVALAAVGATVLTSKTSAPAGGMGFEIIDDPKEVIAYIHSQHLPPATEERREEQARHEELVVWKIRQLPGFSGQDGEVFNLDNGLDSHQYTITGGGQSFGMFAEKTTQSFNFSAGANPSHGPMTGTWTTPAGSTRYDMQTGDAIVVKVR